ncbi:MAG TPA: IMP cyclohydrolase [Spirochaetota bacterium]|jgi:phosphoribosylaminoimidazolecarboxamide formyltransferase/IMP cyclohydrolase|nr:IMP cyclohydrolase [Spirochaetota bacterium]HPM34498.1 IMP cyclohydrolase [Spirochaetota bacterium]
MKDIRNSYMTVMDDHFPDEMSITFGNQTLKYKKRSWKIQDEGKLIEKGLRYGENPGQEAALYELVNGNLVLGKCQFITPGNSLVSSIDEDAMLQSGKHPGKTNFTDIDNSLNILKYFDRPTSVIVKHNNPCGVSSSDDILNALQKSYYADRIAAFGGCVALNKALTKECAEFISSEYFEVVVAPEFENGAMDILSKKKNLRIIKISAMENLSKYKSMRFVDFKSLIDGGIIVQQSPINIINSKSDLKIAETEYKGTKYAVERKPTENEYKDMLFGWNVEQGVTSNSVLYVKDETTVGIGTGEQDRVGVAEIAIFKAYQKYSDKLCFEKFKLPFKNLELAVSEGKESADKIKEIMNETKAAKGGLIGSAMVSDAFFPFRDGVDVAIKEGISAIVQPGGSVRDFESIEACNSADPKVTMVYTGQRAFKH